MPPPRAIEHWRGWRERFGVHPNQQRHRGTRSPRARLPMFTVPAAAIGAAHPAVDVQSLHAKIGELRPRMIFQRARSAQPGSRAGKVGELTARTICRSRGKSERSDHQPSAAPTTGRGWCRTAACQPPAALSTMHGRALRRGSRRTAGCGSELGRQVAVDLEADADLDKDRGCPRHGTLHEIL